MEKFEEILAKVVEFINNLIDFFEDAMAKLEALGEEETTVA